MRTEDAVAHFGSVKELAEALGVTTQAIYFWGETVPELRAFQLELLTEGALRAKPAKPKRRRTG